MNKTLKNQYQYLYNYVKLLLWYDICMENGNIIFSCVGAKLSFFLVTDEEYKYIMYNMSVATRN